MVPYFLIPGLYYLPDWISSTMEEDLLSNIEVGIWENSLKRRVQQFGPRYRYQDGKLDSSLREIPEWIRKFFPDLKTWFDRPPGQIIINEYLPGQGITKHKDAAVFGPTIASLSLLNDAQMLLINGNSAQELLLKRRSLLILSGEARSAWQHCIPPVENKRISITFRTIK